MVTNFRLLPSLLRFPTLVWYRISACCFKDCDVFSSGFGAAAFLGGSGRIASPFQDSGRFGSPFRGSGRFGSPFQDSGRFTSPFQPALDDAIEMQEAARNFGRPPVSELANTAVETMPEAPLMLVCPTYRGSGLRGSPSQSLSEDNPADARDLPCIPCRLFLRRAICSADTAKGASFKV